MLRVLGPEIGRLAKRGDRLARQVIRRYHEASGNPADLAANRELRIAFEEYMNRDLRDAEKYELGSRFGHRTGEVERTDPRIFMPGGKQLH